MVRKRKVQNVCSWCGKEIETGRRSVTKFCNASHRAMFWRHERIVQDRTKLAEKHIDRLAELLSYDPTNSEATIMLKWLKEHIEFFLEQGYQRALPGIDDNV